MARAEPKPKPINRGWTRDELLAAGLCIACQNEPVLTGNVLGKVCNQTCSAADSRAMRGIHFAFVSGMKDL